LQQQQQQQQQQHGGYAGQYSVPQYADIYTAAGHDRRRPVAATADVHGQSSTNGAVHASVSGRVPPLDHHAAEPQRTPQRPQSTAHSYDIRRYYEPQRRPSYDQQPQQQQQQQQRPPHPGQYYPTYYQHHQQPAAPTISRHQQQIHFIVPTSNFDARRIPQVRDP